MSSTMVSKRKKPRLTQTMPQGQKRTFKKIIIAFFVLCLLWVIFAPGAGVYSYLDKRAELARLEKEAARVREENLSLESEIEKLLNDPEYLEDVARKDYNLLKKNERVYDFSREKKKKQD